MESVTKSIIYGNSYENKYGRFMPVCSSISDRGITFFMQHLFSTFLTTFMTLPIFGNIIGSHMPIEYRKSLWSSLPRRRMFRTSNLMDSTLTRQSRGRERNCFISSKNSVQKYPYRCQKCTGCNPGSTVQPSDALRDN